MAAKTEMIVAMSVVVKVIVVVTERLVVAPIFPNEHSNLIFQNHKLFLGAGAVQTTLNKVENQYLQ